MVRALFLFAPKFREFGVDIATRLCSTGAVDIVDGLCTGGSNVVGAVRAGLGRWEGEIVDVEAMELSFVKKKIGQSQIAAAENGLRPGAFGRILTADRRVGSGFVLGGSTRPSRLRSIIDRCPSLIPAEYCANLLNAIATFLDQTKPSFIFLYAHAGSVSAALCELAIQREIPVYRISTARTGSLFLIDSDPLGLFASLNDLTDNGRHVTVAHREWATKQLQDFRSQPAAPSYTQFTASRNSWRRLPKMLAQAMKATGYAAIALPRTGNEDRWIGARRAWYNVSVALKRQFSSSRHFSRSIPIGRRVVYFPLHVDPEASTMVLAPFHTNQLAVVEALSKSLPADAILVVKEHKPMRGLRPRGFYNAISKMPRVVLLSPDVDGLECVKRADLTAVITGTAAWEAIRLKKPTLVIGNSPYLQIGEGILHEPSLSNLDVAVDEALKMPPASDTTLIEFLARLKAVSFELNTSLLWGRYLDHSDNDREAATQAIAEKLAILITLQKNSESAIS